MKKAFGIFGVCFGLAFSAAHAELGTWSSDAIPSHYEFDMSNNPQNPPVFIIGHGGNYYGFRVTDERTRAWAEMIKTAVLNGKKIAIFYDTQDPIVLDLCYGLSNSEVCNETNAPTGVRQVLRVALKYQ